MTALHALPDHQVLRGLVPDIERRRVSTSVALERLQRQPGLLPVAIDPAAGGRVYLADIGAHPLREWQFMYSIEKLAREGALGECFATGLELLQHPEIAAQGLPPAGFVFHTSRCGSTLLAKALGRSPANCVINQGGPLQRGFWAALTGDWRRPLEPSPVNLAMFRNLSLLLARRRCAAQSRSFTKFISWNVLYRDFVRAAFPEVPQLFLYRDPVEVIASVRRQTSAVLESRGSRQAAFLSGLEPARERAVDDIEYLGRCYARYFEAALRGAGDDSLVLVNYDTLKSPAALARVLQRGFGFEPGAHELALMQEQFRFYSKDDADRLGFEADSAEKSASLDAAERELVHRLCGDWLRALDEAPQNLENLT